MKRENVLVSEDALARQREFEAKIKEMFTARAVSYTHLTLPTKA